MATVYRVHEAKTHLSKLLDQVLAGEEVVIARGREQVAKVVPMDAIVQTSKKRVFGSMRGQFGFDESFFDSLPDAELDAWEGR